MCTGDLVVDGEARLMHLEDCIIIVEFGLLTKRGSLVGIDGNQGDSLLEKYELEMPVYLIS